MYLRENFKKFESPNHEYFFFINFKFKVFSYEIKKDIYESCSPCERSDDEGIFSDVAKVKVDESLGEI